MVRYGLSEGLIGRIRLRGARAGESRAGGNGVCRCCYDAGAKIRTFVWIRSGNAGMDTTGICIVHSIRCGICGVRGSNVSTRAAAEEIEETAEQASAGAIGIATLIAHACWTPIGGHITVRTTEIEPAGCRTLGSGCSRELTGCVDDDTGEIDPAKTRRPGITAEIAVTVISHTAIGWRQVDPSILGAPSISSDSRVGHLDSAVRAAEIDPTYVLAPGV